MKDFPSYKSVICYYSDKTKSEKFIVNRAKEYCGSLIYTENNTFHFSPYNHGGGRVILPDSVADSHGFIVPYEWHNIDSIKYILKYNLAVEKSDVWMIGSNIYTKDFYNTLFIDIREFKIKIIEDNFNIKKWEVNY